MTSVPAYRLLAAALALAGFSAPLRGEAPRPSENVADLDTAGNRLTLRQDGRVILDAALPSGTKVVRELSEAAAGPVSETLWITLPAGTTWTGTVVAGPESCAAETRGTVQQKFPLIRTAHGPSTNRRNNAVYERTADWMIEFPEGARIVPEDKKDGAVRYGVTVKGETVVVTFRPAYYRKFKNLPYYTPWTYRVRQDSITGWSSWWAYMRKCNEGDIAALLAVFKDKRFADYGYRFIQLDDAFQGRLDGARKHSPKHVMYKGGHPDTWLEWRTDLFPSGIGGYVKSVRDAGFAPALWMGSFFSDMAEPAAHPDWFVQDTSGKPVAGNWISYVVNSRNKEAVDTLIRPTFRGLKRAGMEYVKIDQLRHMLYDNLNLHPEFAAKLGTTNADLFRGYLGVAREELGKDTFILACWGVLPEAIGLVDACRIGGDGYGPATLQQYNSWNGIVWRNDPDHCDVLPKKGGANTGNVTKLVDVRAAPNDTRIRPALASIAGAMLMLSDKPEVYRDEKNLSGLRKSSPVLFSVPGQLYDYDPRKTDYLRTHDRAATKGGSGVSKIDADQFGEVCPYWLNEFDAAAGHWSVLHRLNWSQKGMAKAVVTFADLGLDPAKDYVVHEFWSGVTLGVRQGSFEIAPLDAMGLASYAIREKLDRPQLISTSRHLSQGAAEIDRLDWNPGASTLSGESRLIAGDDYSLLLRIPAGYAISGVTLDGRPTGAIPPPGEYALIPLRSDKTRSAIWSVSFRRL